MHLAKRGEDPARFDLDALADATRGFSGAEIEQATVSALYETRTDDVPLDTATVLMAVLTTRPLSVVKAEKVAALRAWASEHCVPADGETDVGDVFGEPSRA
jgi:SpoVK/Ycf46/Vps4 family AAA+-type ATPase